MKAIQSIDPNIDRSTWAPGPWDGEPDRYDFRTGDIACFVKRGRAAGAWCGYAGIPREHPWYGKSYDEVDALVECVHGGLTYAAACDESIGICHVPQPGEPDDLWWFGFDCAHAGDLTPAYTRDSLVAKLQVTGDVYRTIDYAIADTARLAMQLAAAANTNAKEQPHDDDETKTP